MNNVLIQFSGITKDDVYVVHGKEPIVFVTNTNAVLKAVPSDVPEDPDRLSLESRVIYPSGGMTVVLTKVIFYCEIVMMDDMDGKWAFDLSSVKVFAEEAREMAIAHQHVRDEHLRKSQMLEQLAENWGIPKEEVTARMLTEGINPQQALDAVMDSKMDDDLNLKRLSFVKELQIVLGKEKESRTA